MGAKKCHNSRRYFYRLLHRNYATCTETPAPKPVPVQSPDSSGTVFNKPALYALQSPERLPMEATNLLAASAIDLLAFIAKTRWGGGSAVLFALFGAGFAAAGWLVVSGLTTTDPTPSRTRPKTARIAASRHLAQESVSVEAVSWPRTGRR